MEPPSTPSRSPATKDDRNLQQSPQLSPRSARIPALMVEVDDCMIEVDNEGDDEGDLLIFRESEALWQREEIYASSAYLPRSDRYLARRSFDAESIASTRSLYESDLEYHMENDRRYVLNYFMPNDEDEQLRMQILHQVFFFLFDSKLTTVPLPNPTKILDIGTGTGEWAIGMGEAFPDADVTGTDISAIQPSAVPSNVFFEVFDAEDDVDWTYGRDIFDLIHFRAMSGSFSCWDLIYQRAYAHLKPGGWIEVVDFDDQGEKFLSCFSPDSEAHAWRQALRKATLMSGMDLYPAHLKPERLAIAGFTDIQATCHIIPIGLWPTDPNIRSMAKLWLVAIMAGLEAMSLRPLTRYLGWKAEEVRRICSVISSEFKSAVFDKEKAKELSVVVKVIIARKPVQPRSRSQDLVSNVKGAEGKPKNAIVLGEPWKYQEEFPESPENGLHDVAYQLSETSTEKGGHLAQPGEQEPEILPGVSLRNQSPPHQTSNQARSP